MEGQAIKVSSANVQYASTIQLILHDFLTMEKDTLC